MSWKGRDPVNKEAGANEICGATMVIEKASRITEVDVEFFITSWYALNH
jgi:hypothetical protein